MSSKDPLTRSAHRNPSVTRIGRDADAPGTAPSALPWATSLEAVAPRRRVDIREYALDEELLLLDPTNRTLFHLNGTAATLWRMCDGRPIRDVAASLASLYGEDPDAVTEDVAAVMDVFSLQGLLESRAGAYVDA